MLTGWAGAFLFTQFVEVPIYFGAQNAAKRRAFASKVAIAFLASAITHPIVWFVIPRFVQPFVLMFIVAEVFAVAVEAVYLHRLGVAQPLLWSIFANASSAGLGLLSRHFFGWP